MAFNTYGQYVANHKVWDHVGNIVPNMEYSEGVRPHGEFMPAAWLPVQFFDKYYEDYMSVMPGKLLAFDNDGRFCPAQYGLASANITYTSTDVTQGVIDVRTGSALLSTATGTFTVASVTNFMGRGVTMAVSAPVGVCPYPFLQWAGTGAVGDDGNNPAFFRQHNYNRQHRAAVLCDYVLELPLVPAATASELVSQTAFSSTDKRSTISALSALPVATNTARTAITFANGTATDTATRFVNQVSSIALVLSSGDWYINLTTGVITVYAASTVLGSYLVSYSNYATAPTGTNVSKFACVLGDIKPGDFLKCNADSNWVKATPVVTGSANTGDTFDVIMGQVLEVESFPKDGLDRVRTAYARPLATNAAGSYPAYAGQMDQMPGSANGGVSDKIHFAGAADKVVRVNLISR